LGDEMRTAQLLENRWLLLWLRHSGQPRWVKTVYRMVFLPALADGWLAEELRGKRVESLFVNGYESSHLHDNTRAFSSHSIWICSGLWAKEDSTNCYIVVTVCWRRSWLRYITTSSRQSLNDKWEGSSYFPAIHCDISRELHALRFNEDSVWKCDEFMEIWAIRRLLSSRFG
jgi:hypothetical protein